MEEISVNSNYKSDEFMSSWGGDTEPEIEGTELFRDPFKCYGLENFLTGVENGFVSKVREETTRLEFVEKNNDLYQFKQSDDMKNFNVDSFPNLCKLRDLFIGPVRQWMTKLSGIDLSDEVSLTVSQYGYTDTLLCHDDELEYRRIAFVLYLTADWSKEDGGRLDMFDCDKDGYPTEIIHSLYPSENKFMFFEVTPTSYHQVSEVLNVDRQRISINGWYHGAPIERPILKQLPPIQWSEPGFIEYKQFVAWVNPDYLIEETQNSIREKFEEESQVQLESFLQKDKYDMVTEQLEKASMKWTKMGPANKRNYKSLVRQSITDDSPLAQMITVLQSEAMFLLLAQLTGAALHPLVENKTSESDAPSSANGKDNQAVSSTTETTDDGPATKQPRLEKDGEKAPDTYQSKYSLEVRNFGYGNYTMIDDESTDLEDCFCLDAQMFFGNLEWTPNHGGYSCYVAKGEEEELLTVVPKGNSLALVYRDPDTIGFIKYINDSAVKEMKKANFTDIALSYTSDMLS